MLSSNWLLLILTVPGKGGSARMRVWRALKATGAGILRDGVYLLPESSQHEAVFNAQAEAVRGMGGTAHVVRWEHDADQSENELLALFDRGEQYQSWQQEVQTLEADLRRIDQVEARKREDALKRFLQNISRIDFFPGSARQQAEGLLRTLSERINRQFSPNEPVAREAVIETLDPSSLRGKTWTTRADLWIDRVASAWLIRRFIDPDAVFEWFDPSSEPAKSAIGFDYNGARFTHTNEMVTFEVLVQSFSLQEDLGLKRLSQLIRYLDTGGIPIEEAAGVLAVISGAKRQSESDDAFLENASAVLDGLHLVFSDGGTRQ
jgi:hypothetical protein